MKNKLLFLFGLLCCLHSNAQEPSAAVKLVQEQLDGYNKRDIDAFLRPYSDTVAVYMFPNQLLYRGKDKMRVEYAAMFQQTPLLHCTLVKRMELGNTVIDEESVVFSKEMPPLHAAAMYTIRYNSIVAVYFIPEGR